MGFLTDNINDEQSHEDFLNDYFNEQTFHAIPVELDCVEQLNQLDQQIFFDANSVYVDNRLSLALCKCFFQKLCFRKFENDFFI